MKVKNIFLVLILFFGYSGLVNAEDKGIKLWEAVIERVKKCAADKSGSESASCYIRATPQKCRSRAIDYMSSDQKGEARRAWYICVASCADAGIWSSTFGECARDLK